MILTFFLGPTPGVVSFIPATFNYTSLKAQREQRSLDDYNEFARQYSVGLKGGTVIEADISLLGIGFNPPSWCPVSNLDDDNWALMRLQNRTIVYRVALMRDADFKSWYIIPNRPNCLPHTGHFVPCSFNLCNFNRCYFNR